VWGVKLSTLLAANFSCSAVIRGVKGCFKSIPPLPPFIRVPLTHVTQSPFFELLSLLIVIANAVALGLERFNMPASEVAALRNTNYVLVILFGGTPCVLVFRYNKFSMSICILLHLVAAVEVLMRWGAAGGVHWDDGVNVAEGLVLIVSIVDIAAQFTGVAPGSPLSSLRVVRALRILRLTFISSAWVRVLKRIGRVRVACTS
jgi:predicted ABC-type exoprotein transport system permease subunit